MRIFQATFQICTSLNSTNIIKQLKPGQRERMNSYLIECIKNHALRHIDPNKDRFKRCRILLRGGADPNCKDSKGNTAIGLSTCDLELFRLLLNYGADAKKDEKALKFIDRQLDR